MTDVISACIFRKKIKIGEFLWSHFNTEDGRENNIFDTLCFTISRKVKKKNECKTRSALYAEDAITDLNVLKVASEVSCWRFLAG